MQIISKAKWPEDSSFHLLISSPRVVIVPIRVEIRLRVEARFRNHCAHCLDPGRKSQEHHSFLTQVHHEPIKTEIQTDPGTVFRDGRLVWFVFIFTAWVFSGIHYLYISNIITPFSSLERILYCAVVVLPTDKSRLEAHAKCQNIRNYLETEL